MVYQTIKPTNETVAKTFAEDTNEQLEAIIVRAAHKEWRLTPLADRQKISHAHRPLLSRFVATELTRH
jgi:acyl-CoA reductase-like NAD-dependent aldehyde dehydrogenase